MKWKLKELSNNQLDLLLEIKRKENITRKTQKAYTSQLGFYLAVWSLRDKGLIMENGIDEDRKKIWTLTELGKKIITSLEEIEGYFGG